MLISWKVPKTIQWIVKLFIIYLCLFTAFRIATAILFKPEATGVFELTPALWRLAPFRPARVAADGTTREAVRFGLRTALTSILYHVYRNMDFLLIGRVLGTRVLGIYQTAFQLGMTPLEIVLQLVNRVQYPIYARLRHLPAELTQAFNRSARSLLLILGPVAALLCFASTDILQLVGAGKWLPAVPMIQVLVWASLLRGLSQLFPQLYNATGRPGFSVVDSLVTGATLVSGLALALWLAPEGAGARRNALGVGNDLQHIL